MWCILSLLSDTGAAGVRDDAGVQSDDPHERATQARSGLERLGIPTQSISDEVAVHWWGQVLAERIPAPAVPAGSPPVSARAWMAAALTVGGFRQPEDREQRARLDDGGPDVHMAVLGVLLMRHMSAGRPQGWTDEGLAARMPEPAEDFARAQRVLDEVAGEVGRLATPEPTWWLKA
jgi:hypothetical protein